MCDPLTDDDARRRINELRFECASNTAANLVDQLWFYVGLVAHVRLTLSEVEDSSWQRQTLEYKLNEAERNINSTGRDCSSDIFIKEVTETLMNELKPSSPSARTPKPDKERMLLHFLDGLCADTNPHAHLYRVCMQTVDGVRRLISQQTTDPVSHFLKWAICASLCKHNLVAQAFNRIQDGFIALALSYGNPKEELDAQLAAFSALDFFFEWTCSNTAARHRFGTEYGGLDALFTLFSRTRSALMRLGVIFVLHNVVIGNSFNAGEVISSPCFSKILKVHSTPAEPCVLLREWCMKTLFNVLQANRSQLEAKIRLSVTDNNPSEVSRWMSRIETSDCGAISRADSANRGALRDLRKRPSTVVSRTPIRPNGATTTTTTTTSTSTSAQREEISSSSHPTPSSFRRRATSMITAITPPRTSRTTPVIPDSPTEPAQQPLVNPANLWGRRQRSNTTTTSTLSSRDRPSASRGHGRSVVCWGSLVPSPSTVESQPTPTGSGNIFGIPSNPSSPTSLHSPTSSSSRPQRSRPSIPTSFASVSTVRPVNLISNTNTANPPPHHAPDRVDPLTLTDMELPDEDIDPLTLTDYEVFEDNHTASTTPPVPPASPTYPVTTTTTTTTSTTPADDPPPVGRHYQFQGTSPSWQRRGHRCSSPSDDPPAEAPPITNNNTEPVTQARFGGLASPTSVGTQSPAIRNTTRSLLGESLQQAQVHYEQTENLIEELLTEQSNLKAKLEEKEGEIQQKDAAFKQLSDRLKQCELITESTKASLAQETEDNEALRHRITELKGELKKMESTLHQHLEKPDEVSDHEGVVSVERIKQDANSQIQRLCDEWSKESQDRQEVEEKLKELEEDEEDLQRNFNHVVVTERDKNEQLLEARRVALQAVHRGNRQIPVKNLGSLDQVYLNRHGVSYTQMTTLDRELYNLQGHMTNHPTTNQRCITSTKYTELATRYSRPVADHLQTAAVERDTYNASGWYPVQLPWHYKEKRELKAAEVIGLVTGSVATREVV